ncbi:proteophosphoglycan 5 [Streptomyces sp. CA-288835]|uniref:proteophosphoglycan 5 n=1 Tax=Streptomyces sp. CA-288835 TaxID=3240069 RepID=UPI003D910671
MGLVTLDLPAPTQLRGRWAAFAAVLAARGWGSGCCARASVWHYDDGGGNWVDLYHLGEDRAVMLGNDHEYSETYYGPAAEYFGEEETDLLAGAPDWWRPVVSRAMATDEYVGFVYGFDGARWQRAEYDLPDGFLSVGLPALNDDRIHKSVISHTRGAPGLGGAEPPADAIDALIAADGDVTEAHVTAVIGKGGWDAAAGAAAAREFLAV